MAETARFELDPVGMAEFARNPEIVKALDDLTKAGVEFARRTAPRNSGEFADSIMQEVVFDKGIMVGRVYSNDWRVHILEKGGEHDGTMAPAFRTLGRTLDFMAGGEGLEVKGTGLLK
jgi:hypothetical protein